jgi:hypothetical protein
MVMTLGDIRTQVEQIIGRSPSDLAVISAQTEIAEALDTGLSQMDDEETNAVVDRFPSLYVYAILAHHAALIRDEQAAAIWRGTFESQKRMVRASMDAEQMAQRPPFRVNAPGSTP